MRPTLFGFGSARSGPRPVVRVRDTPLTGEDGWFDVLAAADVRGVSRAAAALGRRAGLGDPRAAEIAHAVDALAEMFCRHATGGQIALRRVWRAGVPGLEVVAIDRGPGCSDLPDVLCCPGGAAAAARDFGAVAEFASWYDGYSLPGRGTTVTVQFWPRGTNLGSPTPATGIARAIPGERASGDKFAVVLRADGPLVLVADGLGHGPLAAVAAAAAVDAFYEAVAEHGHDPAGVTGGEVADDPAAVVEWIHQAIAHTRGAAIAVAKLLPAAGLVRFAGLGNIAAAVIDPPGTGQAGRTGMISQPGVAGHQRRAVCEFTYPIAAESIVVLHSDGVTDRWDLAAYPGLADHGPLVIATTLLRDAGVRLDDACVVVARAG